jgi:hypothetical protein
MYCLNLLPKPKKQINWYHLTGANHDGAKGPKDYGGLR